MDKVKDQPKYLLVKDTIKQKILRGQLEDKLPGERVLAREFGYSYMTVRKAIDALVDEDVLYREPARGTFVNKGGISGKKTYNIGFFLEPRIKGGISSPYYSLLFKNLEDILKSEGYSLFFFTNMELAQAMKFGKKYDGLIMSCFPEIEKKILMIAEFSPVVIIDNDIKDKDIPYVGIDNHKGVFDAVEYLIKSGHTDIAFISGVLDSTVGNDRLQGYQDALLKNELPFQKKMVIEGDYDFKSGQDAAKSLLSRKKRPTAIVCANDSMAFGVIEGARRMGIQVPDEVSVIGFDDIEFAAQSSPPLTTVKAPLEEIARIASSILFRYLREGVMSKEKILLPSTLVVRGSSKPI